MAISTYGGKEHLVKLLEAACENIKADAAEIFDNLNRVRQVTITITFKPDSALTYEINKEKYAEWGKQHD